MIITYKKLPWLNWYCLIVICAHVRIYYNNYASKLIVNLSGKTLSRKIFIGEKYSSLGKYFVTFPRRKFSPVIFESNFFINIFICQSIITIGSSLFSVEIGSSNETVSPSFSLFLLSVSSFRLFSFESYSFESFSFESSSLSIVLKSIFPSSLLSTTKSPE